MKSWKNDFTTLIITFLNEKVNLTKSIHCDILNKKEVIQNEYNNFKNK